MARMIVLKFGHSAVIAIMNWQKLGMAVRLFVYITLLAQQLLNGLEITLCLRKFAKINLIKWLSTSV